MALGEIHDGLAVSQWAMKKTAESELQFQKAEELGEKKDRFVKKYVDAVKADSLKQCKRELKDIDDDGLKGFEKVAYDLQMERCDE